jgi:hypothetical protein
MFLINNDGIFFLLGDQNSALTTLPQHIFEYIVRNHIQFFLILPLDIFTACLA